MQSDPNKDFLIKPYLVGLGTDIIEISRITTAYERYKEKFLDRIFSTREQEYCSQHRNITSHLAGRFAGKEAIAKALGTGIGSKLDWKDIEIINDKTGAPHVYLSIQAKQRFNSPQILISISHCREYASATAIVLGETSTPAAFDERF